MFWNQMRILRAVLLLTIVASSSRAQTSPSPKFEAIQPLGPITIESEGSPLGCGRVSFETSKSEWIGSILTASAKPFILDNGQKVYFTLRNKTVTPQQRGDSPIVIEVYAYELRSNSTLGKIFNLVAGTFLVPPVLTLAPRCDTGAHSRSGYLDELIDVKVGDEVVDGEKRWFEGSNHVLNLAFRPSPARANAAPPSERDVRYKVITNPNESVECVLSCTGETCRATPKFGRQGHDDYLTYDKRSNSLVAAKSSPWSFEVQMHGGRGTPDAKGWRIVLKGWKVCADKRDQPCEGMLSQLIPEVKDSEGADVKEVAWITDKGQDKVLLEIPLSKAVQQAPSQITLSAAQNPQQERAYNSDKYTLSAVNSGFIGTQPWNGALIEQGALILRFPQNETGHEVKIDIESRLKGITSSPLSVHFFCIKLGADRNTRLDDFERDVNCQPIQAARVQLMLESRTWPAGRKISVTVADSPGATRDILCDQTCAVPLGSFVKVSNDPDFESAEIRVTASSAVLPLQIRSRRVQFIVTDRSNAMRIENAKVAVNDFPLARELTQHGVYYADLRQIDGDLVHVVVSALGFGDYSKDIPIRFSNPMDIQLNEEPVNTAVRLVVEGRPNFPFQRPVQLFVANSNNSIPCAPNCSIPGQYRSQLSIGQDPDFEIFSVEQSSQREIKITLKIKSKMLKFEVKDSVSQARIGATVQVTLPDGSTRELLQQGSSLVGNVPLLNLDTLQIVASAKGYRESARTITYTPNAFSFPYPITLESELSRLRYSVRPKYRVKGQESFNLPSSIQIDFTVDGRPPVRAVYQSQSRRYDAAVDLPRNASVSAKISGASGIGLKDDIIKLDNVTQDIELRFARPMLYVAFHAPERFREIKRFQEHPELFSYITHATWNAFSELCQGEWSNQWAYRYLINYGDEETGLPLVEYELRAFHFGPDTANANISKMQMVGRNLDPETVIADISHRLDGMSYAPTSLRGLLVYFTQAPIANVSKDQMQRLDQLLGYQRMRAVVVYYSPEVAEATRKEPLRSGSLKNLRLLEFSLDDEFNASFTPSSRKISDVFKNIKGELQ